MNIFLTKNFQENLSKIKQLFTIIVHLIIIHKKLILLSAQNVFDFSQHNSNALDTFYECFFEDFLLKSKCFLIVKYADLLLVQLDTKFYLKIQFRMIIRILITLRNISHDP